jgi:hypothetical protein
VGDDAVPVSLGIGEEPEVARGLNSGAFEQLLIVPCDQDEGTVIIPQLEEVLLMPRTVLRLF